MSHTNKAITAADVAWAEAVDPKEAQFGNTSRYKTFVQDLAAATFTLTIQTKTGDRLVTIQRVDSFGNNIESAASFEFELLLASSGDLQAVATSKCTNNGAGTAVTTDARPCVIYTTDATGKLEVDVNKIGGTATTQWLVVRGENGGFLVTEATMS